MEHIRWLLLGKSLTGIVYRIKDGISYIMVLLCRVKLVKIFEFIFDILLIRGLSKELKTRLAIFCVLSNGISYIIDLVCKV